MIFGGFPLIFPWFSHLFPTAPPDPVPVPGPAPSGDLRICLTGAMRPERFVDTDAHFNLGAPRDLLFEQRLLCFPSLADDYPLED